MVQVFARGLPSPLQGNYSCCDLIAAGLQCYAYDPPGGLVSADLAPVLATFCTGVAIGKDAVPRLSLCNINRRGCASCVMLPLQHNASQQELISCWLPGDGNMARCPPQVPGRDGHCAGALQPPHHQARRCSYHL